MTVSTAPRRKIRFQIRPIAAVCLLVVLFWIIVALFAPLLVHYPAGDMVSYDYFGPMSKEYWLGTDYLGRDIYSRLIVGTRYTIGIAFVGLILAALIGITLGLLAAAFGGVFDTILSRAIDTFVGIPNLLLALVIVAGGGSSIPILIGAITVIFFPGCYRFTRSMAVNVNALDFISAARARGEGHFYIMIHEILPNIAGPIMADLGLRFVHIILLLSGLSFLGLGVQPPNADWGALVRENMIGISYGSPAVVVPSLALASLALAINLLIDNLPQRIRDQLE
ncbi:ABC transporter permease [Rhizobium sp. LjRoot98]|uniref:ABC transporter permease n=1 Tax=unclassified Rhizobium TaxID=2613769 RepID=UPI000714539E|nr:MULTISPECIES: ABC transporter permease [unclassified Rhizobium]KQV40385.1 DNA-directed RNA polymerase subunit alpha [Rhizobium sp. Root1204]KQY02748.1 DNA-directed RNA polymerase subunit alpha [Rhizobium sp. Root1334]KRB99354.1 DNA-directed RNA polymerase subunit alpha [Rhizobium sp. Root73]